MQFSTRTKVGQRLGVGVGDDQKATGQKLHKYDLLSIIQSPTSVTSTCRAYQDKEMEMKKETRQTFFGNTVNHIVQRGK